MTIFSKNSMSECLVQNVMCEKKNSLHSILILYHRPLQVQLEVLFFPHSLYF